MYPNPANEKVMVRFSQLTETETQIILTDITGKIIYTNEFPAMQLISLPLNHLQYGVYVLKVVTGNKQFRANLIKQYQ